MRRYGVPNGSVRLPEAIQGRWQIGMEQREQREADRRLAEERADVAPESERVRKADMVRGSETWPSLINVELRSRPRRRRGRSSVTNGLHRHQRTAAAPSSAVAPPARPATTPLTAVTPPPPPPAKSLTPPPATPRSVEQGHQPRKRRAGAWEATGRRQANAADRQRPQQQRAPPNQRPRGAPGRVRWRSQGRHGQEA